MDLGTIFLAVPVTRMIKLRNLTLLPSTLYKWDVQSANTLRNPKSSAFRLEILTPEGSLGPDEEVPVQIHLEALDLGEAVGEQVKRPEQLGSAANPGILRALVPIDVDGMPLPSGFELRANVMGLAVTYHVGTIDSLEQVPAHMKGTPAALQVGIKTDWPKWLLGPDVDAPICLNFSEKNISGKHSMTFAIRNHTGIDSSYNLHFEEFGVPEHEVVMLEYAAHLEAAAHAAQEAQSPPRSPMSKRHKSPKSPRSRAGSVTESPRHKQTATMMTTQSGFSVGSVQPRNSSKVTKQTGTIATVRMGATMERAVATGVAGRVVTQAEGILRRNRAVAPLMKDAEKQLALGIRKGHAATQLKGYSKLHEEKSRMKATSLWSLPGDHSSVASRGHSAGGTRTGKLILSDEHEDAERFRSFHGQQVLNARNVAQEAQQMLEAGHGIAITCASYSGKVPAWGEVELRVDVYSDMCGIYRDRLIVDIVGLPRVHIPIVAKLTGTPVSFEGATLGLNMMGDVPSLDFGDILQNNTVQNRSLRVSNTAPWPIAVNWKLLESAPPQGSNLIKLISSVDPETGMVSYSVVAVEPDDAENPPYKLDPERLVIPAHSSKALNIACEWDTPSHHENFLVGTVEVLPKDAPMPGEESVADRGRIVEPLELLDREEARTAMLQDVATGRTLLDMGQMVVGLRCEVTRAFLETDCNKHLKWICSTSHDYKTHPSFVKEVALSNRSRCNLTFTLKVDTPFSIDSTLCTAPIHPMAMPADSDPSASTTRPQMYTLPPNDCVVLRVRFTPPSKHRLARVVDDVLLFGELSINFSNEEVQKLPLEASVRHPQVDMVPEEMNFSTLHVESTAAITLALTNPTYADATWKIVHAPKNLGLTARTGMSSPLGGSRSATAGASVIALPDQNAPVFEDDAEVFSFEPSAGVIKGNAKRPTIAETKMVTVRFNPKKNMDYKSRFKVEIECGRGGFIHLQGTGSYEENMEPGGATGVIRDHPGFHPLHTGVRGPVIPNEHLHGANPDKPPMPMALPAWYDMDKAMQPQHLTKYTTVPRYKPQ